MTNYERRVLSKEDLIIWDQVKSSLDERIKSPGKRKYIQKKNSKVEIKAFNSLNTSPIKHENSLKNKNSHFSLKKNIKIIGTNNLDKKKRVSLRKGKIDPEKTLDLHGLNAKQAEKRVIDFLQISHMQGARLLLIITGKGYRSRQIDSSWDSEKKTGVLKNSLVSWIENSPMRLAVLDISLSHSKHGGEGAFYVYLRKHTQI